MDTSKNFIDFQTVWATLKKIDKHKLFHPNEIMNYIANMMYSVWKT